MRLVSGSPDAHVKPLSAILDTKPLTSGALPPAECARPGLHEFLEMVYPYYDICIWYEWMNQMEGLSFHCFFPPFRSQTSWIWLETKLVELGMVGSDKNYKASLAIEDLESYSLFLTYPQISFGMLAASSSDLPS